MNIKNKWSGFTLIELLVVVLIIGILATVALPQYKMAVMKSRVATILPVIKSIWTAQEMYFVENGKFTNLWDNLDISPSGCTYNESTISYACGNDWLLNITTDGLIMASYCPKKNTDYNDCRSSRDFLIDAYSTKAIQNSAGTRPIGKTACEPITTLGRKICANLLASGQVEHMF